MTKKHQVGIMLALGYSKKEIAQKTGKSVNTIDNQAQDLYRETGSRNLADITRWVIERYTGVPVEERLINLAHDLTIAVAVAFLTWVSFQPETMDRLSTALSNVVNILTK